MNKETNPFVIGQTDGGDALEGAQSAQQRREGSSSCNNNAAVTEVGSEDVRGLIPLCVQHATGPKLSTATFGYDIGQMQKRPWCEPGARLEDYFNYGFDEKSWRVYCAMQKDGASSLLAKADEMLHKLEQSVHGQAPGVVSDTSVTNGARLYDVDGGMRGPRQMSYGASAPPFAGRPAYHVHMPPTPYGPYQEVSGNGDGGVPYHSTPYGGAYKTKLCQRFAEGRCTRGSECNYAHGVGELRMISGSAGYVSGSRAPPVTSLAAASGYEYGGEMRHDREGNGTGADMQAYPIPPYQAGAGLAPQPTYMPEGLLRRESGRFGDAEPGPGATAEGFYTGPYQPKRLRPEQDTNYNSSYGNDGYA